jgi:hypothetical protein
MVILADTIHAHSIVDVIEHAGQFWLVPEWLENHVRRVRRPARMLPLSTVAHDRMPGFDPEFLVTETIPKDVFDGRLSGEAAARYRVAEFPEIEFPLASPGHH